MVHPAISIVLPTYNGSKYIKSSIESCLTQTFTDFELIIVNDCSTDDTLNIILEYTEKDKRIKVVNNEFNKKLPISLNTGFEKAQGKYFTWTSDDNYYAPEALEEMFKILENNSEFDLVYSDYFIIDENDKVTGSRKFGDINKGFNKWLGAGACFLYKKKIHTINNGYNPAAFLIEDYDFFVRAFSKFNFYYLATPELYFYREHNESLTSTQNNAINDISKIFLERNLEELRKKLPANDQNLLYRKLAVYYAVTKNHPIKYKEYLKLMGQHSLPQVLLTTIYVFITKIRNALIIGFSGIFYSIKLFFIK
jgi:glycosyltransferase involved in cell wall biosynthesis